MLVTPEYKEQLKELHERLASFGGVESKQNKQVEIVTKYCDGYKTKDVLDYGCGKGLLAKHMPFPIKEYDPAIEGKDGPAEPAEFVICSDVLEHVEPELLDNVLQDLHRVTLRNALLIIHNGASKNMLQDGRNAHLIQQPAVWWVNQLDRYFLVRMMLLIGEATQFNVIRRPVA